MLLGIVFQFQHDRYESRIIQYKIKILKSNSQETLEKQKVYGVSLYTISIGK